MEVEEEEELLQLLRSRLPCPADTLPSPGHLLLTCANANKGELACS